MLVTGYKNTVENMILNEMLLIYNRAPAFLKNTRWPKK